MKFGKHSRHLIAPTVLCVGLAACGDSSTGPTPATMTVTPSSAQVALGQTAALSAQLRDTDGNLLSAIISWSSSNPAVASVGATTGVVTGSLPGSATVSASAEGMVGSASISVVDQVAPSVTITSPTAGSIADGLVAVNAAVTDGHSVRRVSLIVDDVEVRSETATGSGGTFSFTWDAGLAAAGSHVIEVEATDSTGNVGSSSLAVTISPRLASLRLTPANLSLAVGAQAEVSVELLDGAGAVIDPSGYSVAWSVSNSNVTLSTVGNKPLSRLASGQTAGTTTVTATTEGISATAIVTVTQAATHTVSVRNYLRLPIVVEINGVVLGQVAEGSASVPTDRDFIIAGQQSIEFEWGLVKLRTQDGSLEFGDDMGGVFNVVNNPGPQPSYTIDNVIGGETFFYPVVTNQIGERALFAFNWGLSIENRCCSNNATGATRFGYFRATDNSNVRAYKSVSNYTGPFVFWDRTTLGVGDFRDSLAALDGYLSLTLNLKPWTVSGLVTGVAGVQQMAPDRPSRPVGFEDDTFSASGAALGRLGVPSGNARGPRLGPVGR